MSTEAGYVTSWRDAVPNPRRPSDAIRGAVRNVTLTAIGALRSSDRGQFLRCLYCHYVFPDQRERFVKILRGLKRQGTFVDTDTCVDMLSGRRRIDGKYFHLSFDDGFRNIFAVAAPVLRDLNLPAITFIPTSLVGADWEATHRYCTQTTRYGGVIELLSWDEIRKMSSWGMEIGSHTRSHMRLADLSTKDSRLNEIDGSKADIEKHLDVECKYISWPYGTIHDIDSSSMQVVRSAGYHACFSAIRGSVVADETDQYCIPRHHFEVQWPLSHISLFAAGFLEKQRPKSDDQ